METNAASAAFNPTTNSGQDRSQAEASPRKDRLDTDEMICDHFHERNEKNQWPCARRSNPHTLSRVWETVGGPKRILRGVGHSLTPTLPRGEKNPEIPIRWEIHTSLAGRLSLSLTNEFPEHGSGAPAQHEAPACFMALNTLYVQRAFAAQ